MSIKEIWQNRNMSALAADWLAEIRSKKPDAEDDVRSAVVLMNFTATADDQWAFIQAAVEDAETDEEFDEIATGPFEHLFGFHGEKYIALLEGRCKQNPKFSRMTLGAWRHLMSEEVWDRVQAIQAEARASLP